MAANIRKFLIISTGSLFLAACGAFSTTALFKPGVNEAQKQSDLDQCKIASFKSIPQAFTTMADGGFYDPGGFSCYPGFYGGSICDRYGDIYFPPTYYAVDRNENLRWRFVRTCLQKKGYNIIDSLRPCASREERRRAMTARTISAFTCNPDASLDY